METTGLPELFLSHPYIYAAALLIVAFAACTALLIFLDLSVHLAFAISSAIRTAIDDVFFTRRRIREAEEWAECIARWREPIPPQDSPAATQPKPGEA